MTLHKAFHQPTDANNSVISVSPNTYGGQVTAADLLVHQLIPLSGTNTGTRTSDTFELTGKDTTGISFANYVLEITQSGYEQMVVIVSNTTADPGVATVRSLHKGAKKGDGDIWFPVLPSAGNLTFIVKPIVYSRVNITVDAGMTGNVTILRGGTNNADSTLAILEATVKPSQNFFLDDLTKLYYDFSVNAGTEIFRWSCS